MATIDDVLEEALHPKHARTATELQQDIVDSRISILEQFYKKDLSPADKAAFEALSPVERTAKLRANNYMLKPESAEQLVRYLGVNILKRHDATMGSQLEAALNKISNSSLPLAERLKAMTEVNNFRAILASYGFDELKMEMEAKEKGFGPEIWNEFTQGLGRGYVAKMQSAALGLIPHTEAHDYLSKTIKPATGINVDVVKGKGIQEVFGVLLNFKKYQKQNDLAGFKKEYHHYHT